MTMEQDKKAEGSLSPSPFLQVFGIWTFDFGLEFGTWILDLGLGLGFGTWI